MENNLNVPNGLPNKDSLFLIEDAYALEREDSTVTYLSGILKSGSFSKDESICIYSTDDKHMATCKILAIERIGRDSLDTVTYIEGDDNQNAYGITINNPEADLFKSDFYVTPLNDRNNHLNKDKIPQNRLDELNEMLINDENKEVYNFLSIQELCFIHKRIKESFSDKKDLFAYIGDVLVRKLNEASELYVTIDTATKQPFLNNGIVDVYSVKSYAEDAVSYYGTQFRKLVVETVKPNDNNLPFFVSLVLLGVKFITVDNGQQHTQLPVDKFISEAQRSNMHIRHDDSHPDFFNPAFKYALDICLSELRWSVNYPNRQQVCEAKDKNMWAEFRKAQMLVPIQRKKEGSPDSNNIAIPHLKNGNGDDMIAIFTDLVELMKIYNIDDWGVVFMDAEKCLSLDDNVGLVINPMSENLVITKERLPKYREEILAGRSPNVANRKHMEKEQAAKQTAKDVLQESDN